jgi:cullin-associated NEDD8-dissociated protein 1
LVKTVRDPQKQEIIDQLSSFLSGKEEELKDIASIGLKTVITEIPSAAATSKTIIRRLLPKLVQLLSVSGLYLYARSQQLADRQRSFLKHI